MGGFWGVGRRHCRAEPRTDSERSHGRGSDLELVTTEWGGPLFRSRFSTKIQRYKDTCGNIPTCASESDPLDLRRPGVWGRGEAAERQYGHALSSHALHSRPRCRHGLPRWSCARPPRAHFAPGFLRRRKQDSMVGSVLDAHSGFRGKCALVFAAMVSVVLSSG